MKAYVLEVYEKDHWRPAQVPVHRTQEAGLREVDRLESVVQDQTFRLAVYERAGSVKRDRA